MECGGTGKLTLSLNDEDEDGISLKCDICMGTGKQGVPCHHCLGEGNIVKKVTEHVEITGYSTMVIKGKGHALHQKKAGDLIIEFDFEMEEGFELEGSNIKSKVEIPVPIALNGGKYKVKTIEGEAMCDIPPMSQTGDEVTLKEHGILIGKKRGDHIAQLVIDIPRYSELSPEVQGLVNQWLELEEAKRARTM